MTQFTIVSKSKKKVLYVLQNAYRTEKYNFKNREEWHGDLLKSHTGKRLSEMIPENCEYFVINASKNIGTHADSKFPPDIEYITNWWNEIQPEIVVACGKVAQEGCDKANIEHIKAPHPAWRALSKEITENIRKMVEG